ncbi:hypothetical protein BCR39DRAFT_393185 [Naematelia encephala]|uniref:Uncharacterized protein n=1 Tax=Naematelia encephala TaxID=71784 RepID=A0A1Y2AJA9_9TREE|nr:hypothetical protein BCR39DRAFT_393185 [Naematelia encephala]
MGGEVFPKHPLSHQSQRSVLQPHTVRRILSSFNLYSSILNMMPHPDSSGAGSSPVFYGDSSGHYEFVNLQTENGRVGDPMSVPRSSLGRVAEEGTENPRFNIDGSWHRWVTFKEFGADLSFGRLRPRTTSSGRPRSEYLVKMTTVRTRPASDRATSTRGVTETETVTTPPTVWTECPEHVTMFPVSLNGDRGVRATDRNGTRISTFYLEFPDVSSQTDQGEVSVSSQSTGNGYVASDLTGFDRSLRQPIKGCSYLAVGDDGSSWKEDHVSVKLNATRQFPGGRIMVNLTIKRHLPVANGMTRDQVVYHGPAELMKNCTHYLSSLWPNPVIVRKDSRRERDVQGTEWEKVDYTIFMMEFEASTQASSSQASGVRRGG